MGRPKLKEEKRRVALSISLVLEVAALTDKTSNRSHFIETAKDSCQAVHLTLKALREKTISLEVAMERIERTQSIFGSLNLMIRFPINEY